MLFRSSRRLEDGIKTLHEVSEKCTVTSMAEGECNETTPEGWFKSSLAFLMAEWSSRITAYKVKSGMDRRANNKDKICESCGVVHLGRHPSSCMCKVCLKKKGRLQPNKENAQNTKAI